MCCGGSDEYEGIVEAAVPPRSAGWLLGQKSNILVSSPSILKIPYSSTLVLCQEDVTSGKRAFLALHALGESAIWRRRSSSRCGLEFMGYVAEPGLWSSEASGLQ